MKRVLFTISLLYGGGAERALSNIMTHFPDDWEIDILLNDEDSIEFPYKGRLITLGIPAFDKKKSIFYLVKETIIRTKYLRKLKKENHYDACISFLDSANIANILSGNRKCKTIISIRVNMTAKQTGFLHRMASYVLIRGIYNRAEKIVAVSKEIESEMLAEFNIPQKMITSIVNGYDCEKILQQANKIPSQLVDIDSCKLVVTVGRLEKQKGQWHLIRAFSEVVKREPKAKLLILGTGELKKYFEELIEVFHLEQHVILTGYCDNPFWYDTKADVFVLPSLYEGFPNALAEAICCGVPCVATDFQSGAREILDPEGNVYGQRISDIKEVEYGILTPLCSGKRYKGKEPLEEEEKKLAEAILFLLINEDKNMYYREQSRKRRKDLDINSVVQEWIRVIEE